MRAVPTAKKYKTGFSMEASLLIRNLKYRMLARIPVPVQRFFHLRHTKKNYRTLPTPDHVLMEMGNDLSIHDSTWFRGDSVNYMPSLINLYEKNAIRDYILHGWLPKEPFIQKHQYITAFGSCFAAHILGYLKERGYNVFGDDLSSESFIIQCGEGMVNTFSIAQQFQWAYGEMKFPDNLWFDKSGSLAEYDEKIRLQTKTIFEKTDIFVITLGLSEVWYDKITGDACWRAIPRSKYDPSRHGFKISTVAENIANLNTIYRIIRERRPHASIIFTLSPIPLFATFRPVSCITANSVSKSILRAAVDEFYRSKDDQNLFYFPSYELVKEYYHNAFGNDNRHVHTAIVEKIMDIFANYYCKPSH
jgi:GSCFA family